MPKSFAYDLGLPHVGAPDVKTRELSITVAGQASVLTFEASTRAHTLSGVPEGAVVSITLVDIDDAGNRSLPSPALVFTAVDDVPPDQPAAVVITNHHQIFTPEPANEPPPTLAAAEIPAP